MNIRLRVDTICIYPSTIMWVFLFYERADQNTTSTQQRVQTERRVIITGLFKLVLVFFLTKTDEESPVIITSLSFCYELWLIVERKYIRCTALVELYTFIKSKFDKTLVCLLKSYFYLLILIWATFFVMFLFMWIQLGHHLVYLFDVFRCFLLSFT